MFNWISSLFKWCLVTPWKLVAQLLGFLKKYLWVGRRKYVIGVIVIVIIISVSWQSIFWEKHPEENAQGEKKNAEQESKAQMEKAAQEAKSQGENAEQDVKSERDKIGKAWDKMFRDKYENKDYIDNYIKLCFEYEKKYGTDEFFLKKACYDYSGDHADRRVSERKSLMISKGILKYDNKMTPLGYIQKKEGARAELEEMDVITAAVASVIIRHALTFDSKTDAYVSSNTAEHDAAIKEATPLCREHYEIRQSMFPYSEEDQNSLTCKRLGISFKDSGESTPAELKEMDVITAAVASVIIRHGLTFDSKTDAYVSSNTAEDNAAISEATPLCRKHYEIRKRMFPYSEEDQNSLTCKRLGIIFKDSGLSTPADLGR